MPEPVEPRRKFNPWVTPKIFRDPTNPDARVKEFFDHYWEWIERSDEVVLNFATGNGDHILNYRGLDHVDDTFDWARYNCFGGAESDPFAHNTDWLTRVREGGERSGNPYMAGPMFILSEALLSYRVLANIYRAFREEAARRGVTLILLEYLEPGPEFCRSAWKTERHPEGALGKADAGGNIAAGLIDVCSTLHEDARPYAAYPEGIREGTITGDFVAGQAATFVNDLGLDGIFLGNQFGLLGLWDPRNAPEPTDDRRAGVTRFFTTMRERFGEKRIYWQDTFWPAAVESANWAMDPANYALLDGVMCSNFAVLVERTNILPNIRGKLELSRQHGGRPEVFFSVDFVDPWYWYRVHLDDRRNFVFQHDVYREIGAECSGISFFANDTFGQFVPSGPLSETLAVVRESTSEKAGA